MKDQVVLITGSSSGIGREAAYRFALAGAKLIVTYHRNRRGGKKTCHESVERGAADTLLIRLDVMSNRSITAAVKRAQNKYGKIDFLINNAGIGVFLPLKDQTTRDIERQIRTNLEGLIKVTRAFLPHIRKGVINIASFLGKNVISEASGYCASKFGVRGFTEALAEEYPRLNICCINPDMIATRMTEYEGRPPAEVADIIFRAASKKIRCERGRDVDVWEVLK